MSKETILLIVGLSILGLVLLFIIFLFIAINVGFNKRCEYNKYVHYLKISDFEGLHSKATSFLSKGTILRGEFFYHTFDEYSGVVVVSHGIGDGYYSYIREIDHFAKNGFVVFAFDDCGCASSSGHGLKTMTRALIDMESACKYLRSIKELEGYKLCLFGHSMGGYAVSNAISLVHPYKVVSLSGFQSFPEICAHHLHCPIFRPFVFLINFCMFSYYACYKTSTSFNDSDCEVIYMQGSIDNIVKKEWAIDVFKRKVHNPKIQLIEREGYGHSPHYTLDASTKINEFFAIINKNPTLKGEDIKWNEIYQLDEEVMDSFVKFFKE